MHMSYNRKITIKKRRKIFGHGYIICRKTEKFLFKNNIFVLKFITDSTINRMEIFRENQIQVQQQLRFINPVHSRMSRQRS